MLRNFVILVFVLVVATFSAEAQKNEDKTADETAIRAAVKQMETGWNAKRGADFAKPFAEDADYVVVNGMYIRGRAAIDKGHQGIFDTIYKNTTLALAVEQIRFLRPDVAIAHVAAALTLPDKDSSRVSNARITLVLAKTEGRWEIAAFQNTGIEAQPQKK